MFLFYGDESGYSGEQFGAEQPVLVVAGILLNTHGASKTRREFTELLAELSELAGTELTELKGQALFRGSGAWAGVGHADRAAARRRILEWLEERGHKVVASGLVYARLEEARAACPGLAGMSARAIATVHTALAIQRAKYAANASGRRKSATLLFFDRQDQDESAVAAAIATPPDWAVEFVGDRAADGELTAIVDTAYFVDSVQAPLIQLADFVAYMIMRKAALDEGAAPKFGSESDVVNSIFEQLEPLLLERSHRLPRQPATAAATALRTVSPSCLD